MLVKEFVELLQRYDERILNSEIKIASGEYQDNPKLCVIPVFISDYKEYKLLIIGENQSFIPLRCLGEEEAKTENFIKDNK